MSASSGKSILRERLSSALLNYANLTSVSKDNRHQGAKAFDDVIYQHADVSKLQ